LLEEHSPAGAGWPLHCRQVARVARLVADELAARGARVDPEAVETQALLHDVGRSLTHGPLHGWTGFVLVRARGHPAAARGCLTHWIKGRSADELLHGGRLKPGFVGRVFEAYGSVPWSLQDSVMSFADSSVAHTTIVPLAQRHADLVARYGDSRWMRRAAELAEAHAAEIGAALGFPVARLLEPLHGDCLDPR
jgi:putative nucleotidyltransferase with HDIG domain